MAKRSSGAGSEPLLLKSASDNEYRRSTLSKPKAAKEQDASLSTMDGLAAIADLCLAAREIAKTLDRSFLVYLLSMAHDEAQSSMRNLLVQAPPE